MTMRGYIYVLQAVGTDKYKIGFTTRNPDSRLKELQTGCPFPLQLNHVWKGSLQEELELHKALQPFRLEGEWFDLKLGILLEAISYTRQHVLKPSSDSEACSHTEDVLGQYGTVQVTCGPLKSLEGHYSADVPVSLSEVAIGYRDYVQGNEESFLAAQVYILDEGDYMLPHSVLAIQSSVDF
jgi:hypothetical protein